MFEIFSKHNNILAVLSDKKDGPMKLSGVPEIDAEYQQNRDDYIKKFNIKPDELFSAQLIHGDGIEIIDNNSTVSSKYQI